MAALRRLLLLLVLPAVAQAEAAKPEPARPPQKMYGASTDRCAAWPWLAPCCIVGFAAAARGPERDCPEPATTGCRNDAHARVRRHEQEWRHPPPGVVVCHTQPAGLALRLGAARALAGAV